MMRVFSLFSGIGALDLGLEWAGMQTVGFCEIEPACRFWLREHWPAGPIFEDIRTLSGEAIRERCGSVDLVAGGFPCQDISSAGKGAGLAGARSGLWFEMLRIVRELRPNWVLAENVPALRTRGADAVLEGLAAEGYACWPLVVGADDAGLPHRRKRVWLVAHANGAGGERQRSDSRASDAGANGRHHALGSCAVGVGHADRTGQPRERIGGLLDGERAARGHDVDGRGERPLGNADGNAVREQPRRCRGESGQDPAELGGPGAHVRDRAAASADSTRKLEHADGAGCEGRQRTGDGGGGACGGGLPTAGPGGARMDDAQGEPERRRDDAARQPDATRPGDPTGRGVVARPGERQREWEAPRLADAGCPQRGLAAERSGGSGGSALQATRPTGSGGGELADADREGRSRAGADAHAERDGSTEVGGRDGTRESQSSVGHAAARTARRLARLATATRRARLRALGNCVSPQPVAAVGRAIMQVERGLRAGI